MSQTTKEPVVVGQLGCGYWGPNLLRNFSTLPGCRLKWVAEPASERRAYVSSRFPGARVTASWKEVLADDEVEAVAIATPAATHFDLAAETLEAGKHVLVEKPLAMSARDAETLASSAKRRGRVLMAGHTFLYSSAIRYVQGLVSSGEIGAVYFIYTQRLNLGQVRSDVNAWWNLGPHDVSILLYLRGGQLPARIAARGLSFIQPGIEDVVLAVLTWPDGASAHIHVSWLDPGKIRKVTVVGSGKMVVWDDTAENKVTVLDKGVDRIPRIGERMDYDDQARTKFDLQLRSGDIWLPRVDDGKEPLATEITHFLECIRGGVTPLTGASHARDVVAILEAGQQSLKEQGAPVAVT